MTTSYYYRTENGEYKQVDRLHGGTRIPVQDFEGASGGSANPLRAQMAEGRLTSTGQIMAVDIMGLEFYSAASGSGGFGATPKQVTRLRAIYTYEAMGYNQQNLKIERTSIPSRGFGG